MKRTIIALTLALLATTSFASDGWSLQLHGLSWHAKPRAEFDNTGRGWQERNAGLGVRRTFSPDWSVQGGFYRNSIDRTSVYALANWTPVQAGPLRMGGFAGVASGYNSSAVIAGALIELGPVSMRVIPPIRHITPLTLGFEVGIRF